jgi:hypothetical protein
VQRRPGVWRRLCGCRTTFAGWPSRALKPCCLGTILERSARCQRKTHSFDGRGGYAVTQPPTMCSSGEHRQQPSKHPYLPARNERNTKHWTWFAKCRDKVACADRPRAQGIYPSTSGRAAQYGQGSAANQRSRMSSIRAPFISTDVGKDCIEHQERKTMRPLSRHVHAVLSSRGCDKARPSAPFLFQLTTPY